MPTTLYIDTDACPVKEEAVRVAERHGLAIHFVSNAFMRLPEGPLIKRVVVADGHDAAIIESGASDAARTAALNARDRTVGYMLLVYRNFVAGAVKAGSELAGLGADTWKYFRKHAPPQFSNAGAALVIAALVNALLGPTVAVGAFALSFKPLRDRAKRVADRLSALTRKPRKPSKDNEQS